MKNFTKFTAAALVLGSLGLTSCVDDSISSEVSGIYQNQAAYIAAQTSLINAETALENANVAYQLLLNDQTASNNDRVAAQNQLAINSAENSLELAQQNHIKALFELKLAVEAAKINEADDYLVDFLNEKSNIIGLEADLTAENLVLSALNAANVDGVYTKEEAIALKNLEITKLQNDLGKQQAKLAMLEDVLADPTSTGAQVLDIQTQIDDIKALNKEKNARITEINTTELSVYGDDLNDFITAKGNVQWRTANAQAAADALAQANINLTEAQAELDVLTGGATITYAQAVQGQSVAQADFNVKNQAYIDINNLSGDYSTLINQIANLSSSITFYQTQITALTTGITGPLQADYDTAKSNFDANPTFVTVTSIGVDGKAGIANDGFANTYYEVTGTGPYTFGATAYVTGSLPGGAAIGNNVGEYRDVEADDTTQSNQSLFNSAQQALLNAQVQLADYEAQLAIDQANLIVKQALEAEYDSTVVNLARAERDAAVVAFNLANNIVSKLNAIDAFENTIAQNEVSLADANQALANAQSEVARLQALISPAELVAYTALLDQVDALNLEISLNNTLISNLNGDIIYLDALELALDASNYTGANYQDRLDEVAQKIEDEKTLIAGTIKDWEIAKNKVLKLTNEVVKLEAQLAADKEASIAKIANIQAEIDSRNALAARYLALMNSALA